MILNELYRYERIHGSIREHMIPMRLWINNVRKFESNGNLYLGLNGISEREMTDFYTVPYPYRSPAYMDIILERGKLSTAQGISKFTQEETETWAKMVRERVNPFIYNSVHKDVIALADSNYDFGCVLQAMTGYLFFFDYSKVKGFNVFSFMEPTAVKQLQQLKCAGVNLETDGIPGYVLDWMEMNRAFYAPIWKDENDRDIFHPSGDCSACMTTLVPMSDEQLNDVKEHLFLSFREHMRCIVIP